MKKLVLILATIFVKNTTSGARPADIATEEISYRNDCLPLPGFTMTIKPQKTDINKGAGGSINVGTIS